MTNPQATPPETSSSVTPSPIVRHHGPTTVRALPIVVCALLGFFVALVTTMDLGLVTDSSVLFGKLTRASDYVRDAIATYDSIGLASKEHGFLIVLYAIAVALLLWSVHFRRPEDTQRWGLSAWIPAGFFAFAMVFGYALEHTMDVAVLGGSSVQLAKTVCALAGWTLLVHALLVAVFDLVDMARARIARRDMPGAATSQTAQTTSLPRRVASLALDRHPFLGPLALVILAWLPVLLGSYPGIMMGDTFHQMLQFYNRPSEISDSVVLLDPNVYAVSHHPVLHTYIMGGLFTLGMAILGDETAAWFFYTLVQFVACTMACAYILSFLARARVSLLARGLVLALFMFMPLFPVYAVLATKDALYACCLVLLVVGTLRVMGVGAEVRETASQGQPGETARAECTPTWADWARLVVGALGVALLRNGAILVVAAVAVVLALACPRERARVLATLGTTTLACGLFLFVISPALSITPGSPREMLSIPFQQTARYVLMHGDEVTDGERAAIDAVLDYENLPWDYCPWYSDSVKNKYHPEATSQDLRNYFSAWAGMFAKDPLCYLVATMHNYFGYFYVTVEDVAYYSTVTGAGRMETYNDLLGTSIHTPDNALVKRVDDLTTTYRFVFQLLPGASLLMSSALYSWMLIALTAYCLHHRRTSGAFLVALVAPWLVFLMCLIGPVNGDYYTRYIYPLMLVLPMLVALLFRYARHDVAVGGVGAAEEAGSAETGAGR